MKQWNSWHWFLFWFFWSVLISAIYWILGPYSYLRIQDNADFNLPYRIIAARDMLDHGLTWWQPKFAGGAPSWAYSQINNFLINGPLYMIMPAWAAYGLVMWMQRFVAGYFTFKLCRDFFKLNTAGSLFAGLAFSMFLWNSQDLKLVDGLGLPAIALHLILFHRCLELDGLKGLLAAFSLGALISLVAEIAIYTIFFCGALPLWFVLVHPIPRAKLFRTFSAFFLGVVLAALPSVIGLKNYVPYTARNSLENPNILSSLADFSKFFLDNVYTHAIQDNRLYLCMFAVGMLFVGFRSVMAWRLMAAFVISGAGSVVLAIGQLKSGDILPPSRGNVLDFSQFTLFIGPLLGGIGLHLFGQGADKTRLRIVVPLVTILTLSTPVIAWVEVTRHLMHRFATDNYAINFNNPVLADLGRRDFNPPFRVATVATWPPTVASASGGRLYPAYAYAYGLESVDGYFRMHSARYQHFWMKVIEKTVANNPALASRAIKSYFLFDEPRPRFEKSDPLIFSSRYNLDLLSLANVRFLVSLVPVEHESLTLVYEPVKELAEGRRWLQLRLREKIVRTLKGQVPQHAVYLYENKNVLPRFFLADKIRWFDNSKELLDAMSQQPANVLRQTLFMQRSEAGALDGLGFGFSQSRVDLEQYTPDRLVLNTLSDGPGLLFIGNNFDPYWQALLDGQPGTLFPADHAFQCLFLPQGKHRIVLEYRPPYRF